MLEEQEMRFMEEMKTVFGKCDNAMIKPAKKDTHTTSKILEAFKGEMEVMLTHQEDNFKVVMLK